MSQKLDLLTTCKNNIINDEGYSPLTYIDIYGNLTIGYGFNLSMGLPIAVADKWIEVIIEDIMNYLSKSSIWDNLNDARRYVLVNMSYNMGIDKLMMFNRMIMALSKADYVNAEKEMENSQWSKQLPERSARLRKIMLTGVIDDYEDLK